MHTAARRFYSSLGNGGGVEMTIMEVLTLLLVVISIIELSNKKK